MSLLLDSAAIIRTDKDSHFTGAIAQFAAEEENIGFPTDWATVGIQKVQIESLTLISDQALSYDIQFYSKDTFANTDIDSDKFVKTFKFVQGDGIQRAGANQYYYDISPDSLPYTYIDEDNSSEFHIALINRSATAKNAGATGEVTLIINAVPIL